MCYEPPEDRAGRARSRVAFAASVRSARGRYAGDRAGVHRGGLGVRKLEVRGRTISKVRDTSRGNRERVTTEASTSRRAAVEGAPVEMVPTTAREHITGFAALNIPHAWRLGGDWHDA